MRMRMRVVMCKVQTCCTGGRIIKQENILSLGERKKAGHTNRTYTISQVSTLLWACCRIGVRSRFVNEPFSLTLEWRRDSRPDAAVCKRIRRGDCDPVACHP